MLRMKRIKGIITDLSATDGCVLRSDHVVYEHLATRPVCARTEEILR